MRIDKFLKVSRLIKRRTVANEVADAGRIVVNGREVKASYQVKIGDEIEIMFGTKPVKVKVLSVDNIVSKDGARKCTPLLRVDTYKPAFRAYNSLKEGLYVR